jgi:superfamily II DNA or RNA helicase/HKD family nuclease
MFSRDALLDGIRSGLVEHDPDVSDSFKPHLVLNDLSSGSKTLEFILNNISNCIKFRFAVAFVTRSGVACIHQILKEFCARGGVGEILVSRYLNFSDPTAIKLLKNFENISVKFVSAQNYHGKTFLFEFDDYANVLIGSSNLTQDALGKNTEVNLATTVSKKSSLYAAVDLNLVAWSKSAEIINDDVLHRYSQEWVKTSQQLKASNQFDQEGAEESTISSLIPNNMQKEALYNLDQIRKSGCNKSLLISATGTGKTVLSALDAKQVGAKKLLFVVHRLNIAKKAMAEFRRVFGNEVTMGIYSSGEELNTTSDYIFSTVQTINSDFHIRKFNKTEFDYIIIDETHRAGAKTYQRIIDYFKPKFLLGMTATPERTDGFDIFSLFNHSIGYEIRLQKAMEADLLAPFHYFGVTDITLDGKQLDDKADFNKLSSEQRVNHIIETLNEYGCDSGKPRGLVFCSRIDEARALSAAFNSRGLKSKTLTGDDTEEDREEAIQRLESDGSNKLDYLFTVDIFNEGVDIPSVNQVVMLRPTTSSIVFVQQLGRGLRKSNNKEYLTVIDFIGNYQNNFLIPIALFGDTSFNKDKLRRLLNAGSSMIPGASTISFTQIARDLIFKSIDKTKLDTKKLLKEDYKLLQHKLGRLPMMMDFINYQSRDPYQYVENFGSLLKFSQSIDPSIVVPKDQLELISYLSKHVFDGKRLEECIILKNMFNLESVSFSKIRDEVFSLTKYIPSDETLLSAINNINLNFATVRSGNANLRVSEVCNYNLLQVDGEIISKSFSLLSICSSSFLLSYLNDLVDCGLATFFRTFDLNNFIGGFKRGEKYSRKDVFRILNFDKRPNEQNIGGYFSDGKSCPIFTTYKKSDNISATTKYEDRFINSSHLVYMSKSRRNLLSPDVREISCQKQNNLRIPFFAKKNDDEGTDFYYLGDLTALSNKFEESTMSDGKGKFVSVVKMEFMLDKPVEPRLFKYLCDFSKNIY